MSNNNLYEMTILAKNGLALEKYLAKYYPKIKIERQVSIYPYMVFHLKINDTSRHELAKVQDQFLYC